LTFWISIFKLAGPVSRKDRYANKEPTLMKIMFSFRSRIINALICLAGLFLILEDLSSFGQSDCVAPPSGIAAWWPAEGSANDIIGGIHGLPVNGTSFAAGYVGQAFNFNGINQYITNSGVRTFAIAFNGGAEKLMVDSP
jgi:hypothetical protein